MTNRFDNLIDNTKDNPDNSRPGLSDSGSSRPSSFRCSSDSRFGSSFEFWFIWSHSGSSGSDSGSDSRFGSSFDSGSSGSSRFGSSFDSGSSGSSRFSSR